MKRILAILAAGLLAFGLAACSSSSKKSNGSTSGGTAAITIQNINFGTPSPVKAGSTVTVKNNDSFDHTVTADDGGFDVTVHGGSTATFPAPSTPGSYKIHCKIHSNMHATLTVT